MKRRLLASAVALALAGAACTTAKTTAKDHETPSTAADGAMTPAAKTRVALDQLLGEHVFLAAAATNAALAGRTAEFTAAAAALDKNSHAVANAIAGPLKKTPEQAYEFWASHVGFFVDYTKAVGAHDKTKQQKAVNDLLGYAKAFGSLVNTAIPSLPADAVEGLVKDHITGLKAVVDDQAAKNFTKAGSDLDAAFTHMDMIAKALAGALGLQGKADSTAADTHSLLTQLLGEHVYAAAMATGSALAGRATEFTAVAKGILDGNSHAIANAVAGPLHKTPDQAYEFWNSHIGFFVDYTKAVGAHDKTKQQKAVNDLLGYAKAFGTLVNSAIPSLPAATVEDLVKAHVVGLKDVVDAQGDRNFAKAYDGLREAFMHMDMIGGALAQAVAG